MTLFLSISSPSAGHGASSRRRCCAPGSAARMKRWREREQALRCSEPGRPASPAPWTPAWVPGCCALRPRLMSPATTRLCFSAPPALSHVPGRCHAARSSLAVWQDSPGLPLQPFLLTRERWGNESRLENGERKRGTPVAGLLGWGDGPHRAQVGPRRPCRWKSCGQRQN